MRQSRVPGGGHTGVQLMDVDDPIRIAMSDSRTAIGRSIVDHDDLKRWVLLHQDALYCIGEERFSIEWRAEEDDSVWYEIRAHSRPAHPLVRLGYPLVRLLQRRFVRDSQRAMQEAIDP